VFVATRLFARPPLPNALAGSVRIEHRIAGSGYGFGGLILAANAHNFLRLGLGASLASGIAVAGDVLEVRQRRRGLLRHWQMERKAVRHHLHAGRQDDEDALVALLDVKRQARPAQCSAAISRTSSTDHYPIPLLDKLCLILASYVILSVLWNMS
jgi:hypothetical protein